MSDFFAKRAISVLVPIALVLLVFAVAPATLSAFGKGYFFQVANLVLIFALLAASLHLVTGVGGLLHLGHAAFYGIGAYVAALMGSELKLGFLWGLPAAGLARVLRGAQRAQPARDGGATAVLDAGGEPVDVNADRVACGDGSGGAKDGFRIQDEAGNDAAGSGRG